MDLLSRPVSDQVSVVSEIYQSLSRGNEKRLFCLSTGVDRASGVTETDTSVLGLVEKKFMALDDLDATPLRGCSSLISGRRRQ